MAPPSKSPAVRVHIKVESNKVCLTTAQAHYTLGVLLYSFVSLRCSLQHRKSSEKSLKVLALQGGASLLTLRGADIVLGRDLASLVYIFCSA